MFKRILLLVIGGLALREAHKRGYLDAPSRSKDKWTFPTTESHGDTPPGASAPTAAGTSASPAL